MTTQAKLGTALLHNLIKLREQKGAVRIEDVGAILEGMAGALHHHDSVPDNFIRSEIQKMANYIAQAKKEISGLVPEPPASEHFAGASEQLGAVVKATEEATNAILDAADVIQQSIEKGGDSMSKQISDAVVRIYDACNFQDITGQRINKVIGTLEFIENKIMKLIALFGVDSDTEDALEEKISKVDGKQPRKYADLLNGPELNAPDQAAIDALFASLNNKPN